MVLDVNTLFLVTMDVEIVLGLLLYFAWSQNFSKRALAWWGSAHLMRAVSIMLFGLHGSVPNSISIDLANAALFAALADLIGVYGEDAVGKMTTGLSRRIQHGEFTLKRTPQ